MSWFLRGYYDNNELMVCSTSVPIVQSTTETPEEYTKRHSIYGTCPCDGCKYHRHCYAQYDECIKVKLGEKQEGDFY